MFDDCGRTNSGNIQQQSAARGDITNSFISIIISTLSE